MRGLFKRLLLGLAFVLAAACQSRENASVANEAAPGDIILVTIDTWRADAAGFAGNARVKTPFLDSLASRGVVFTNAHAHNVVTLPSHVNILTGLYPYQHGVRDNAGFTLDAKHFTLASALRQQGYATGAFVAAYPLDAKFGLNRGFDVYDDNYGKGVASLDFVIQERAAPGVLDSASRWWNANGGKKRFLWIHVYDPHAPYRPPAPFDAQYASEPYLGEVAALDDALSRSLTPLLAGSPEATVIVTADHGEALGDHGEATHGLFAYESTLKVPLIVVAPGAAHRVEPAYVRHIDIAPTILARAGVAAPKELLGRSLLTAIDARDTYFESLSTSLNRGWAPLTGIIRGDRKYIDLPLPELYDLASDPAELENLREEQRREVEASRQALASLNATAPVAADRNVSAEEAARLRSLGYVAGTAATSGKYTAADDPKNLIDLDRKMHAVVESYQTGDGKRALTLAREVVAARPQMTAGRELLAFVLQQNERVGDAIQNLRSLVADGKGGEDTRVQLGLLLTETGQVDDALTVLAPLASSKDPKALNAYGIALADKGRVPEATAQFRRALEIDSNDAPALQNLGIVALREGNVAEARQQLTHALELNPRLPLALNTLGVVHAQQGDFARAVELWNQAVAIDARQYDALFNIGLAEGRLGRRAEARAALRRFVDTAPAARYAADIATARQALASLQ